MSQSSPSKLPRTPATSRTLQSTPGTNGKTPTHFSTSHRLLYRGALSLPDSHILLDGLAFVAKLESPTKHVSNSLLNNALALALESMRGRPSLRFLGVTKLSDIYMDESGCVEMDIHPRALVSRIYFENMFCLKPLPSKGQSDNLRSDIGVKIALGDSDGPETTHAIVYAELPSQSSTEPGSDTPTIQLNVARITTRPPQKAVRLPRPDDPTPRKPPVMFSRDLHRVESNSSLKRVASGSLQGSDLKRVASGSLANVIMPKRPKLVGGGNSGNGASGSGTVSGLGSNMRLGPTKSSGDVFKVPELPVKQAKADVFGGGSQLARSQSVQSLPDDDLDLLEGDFDAGAVERDNKNKVKKATIAYLAKTKDPSKGNNTVFDKHHPDQKEFYAAVYRGICFALRGRIRLESLDPTLVERLLKMHTRMYLTGLGPPTV